MSDNWNSMTATTRQFRLYRLRPALAPICLFEILNRGLQVLRLIQPDPVAETLGGGGTAEDKLKLLREAVGSGDYVVSRDDPTDWPLRGADVIHDLDEILG